MCNLSDRAGIVMGGHDGTGNIHTSVLVQLKNDVTCSSPPIPSVPSNAQELYGRPMAYVEPFLIMSGGWNSDGSSVKSTLTLDLLDLVSFVSSAEDDLGVTTCCALFSSQMLANSSLTARKLRIAPNSAYT